MKTYISLPITGHDFNQVVAQCRQAAAHLRQQGHTPVSPIELHPDQDRTCGQYIGRDIEVLIDQCEAIYFCEGWETSKGCQLEWHTAKIYQKQEMYENPLMGELVGCWCTTDFLINYFERKRMGDYAPIDKRIT